MDAQYYVDRNTSTEVQQLGEFLNECDCVTAKGDKSTNVIDLTTGKTFAFDDERLGTFLNQLEACRIKGTKHHFMERQNTDAVQQSGIMIDLDLCLAKDSFALDERACQRMVHSLIRILSKDLELNNDEEMTWHFFFIVRPKSTPIRKDGKLVGYKHGVHILIPSVRVSRPYKKYMLSQIRKDENFMSILSKAGVVGSPSSIDSITDCVDFGSASVPVLFFGSSKHGGLVYGLYQVMEATGTKEDFSGVGVPIITALKSLNQFNMVYEMSLCARPSPEYVYNNGVDGSLVKVNTYQPRTELIADIETFASRSAGCLTLADEIRKTDRELDSLISQDAEARYVKELLSILPDNYSEDYHKWRNVVFALANTSKDYLIIAIWFSQRSPKQWAKDGLSTLTTLWDQAVDQRHEPGAKLTKKSIIFWAKEANLERFRDVSNRSYHNILADAVFKHRGKLGHSDFAKILKQMLGDRFVSDTIRATNPRNEAHVWYEFVSGGRSPYTVRPGEIWKWRREVDPVEFHLYISNELTELGQEVLQTITNRKDRAENAGHAKYFTDVYKKFSSTIASLSNDSFQKGIIRQSVYNFMRAGFTELLDKEPNVRGVGNGVLCLKDATRSKTVLLQGYHEHPVMCFTPTKYREFDPEEPHTKLLLDMIKKIIPEVDARIKLMMHQSTGLRLGLKDPWLPMLIGSGSNAKTTLFEFAVNTLGSQLAVPIPISLLVEGDTSKGQSCNAAIDRMDNKSYVYLEESEKKQILTGKGLKTLVNTGKISNNGKFKDQKEIRNTQTCSLGSNFGFVIPTKEHGTWRRLGYYNAKAKFTPDPDPNNPYEHKEDLRFATEYIDDPEFHSAYLSILVHFWDRLQDEYGGSVRKVPSPTIDYETEMFRISQDTIHRFIVERVVRAPKNETRYSLANVAAAYSTWYSQNIVYKVYVVEDVIDDVLNSVLKNFLNVDQNTERYLMGCRIMEPNEAPVLRSGEEWLGVRQIQEESKRVLTTERPDWWNWKHESKPLDFSEEDALFDAEEEKENSAPVENDDSDFLKIEIPHMPKPKITETSTLLQDIANGNIVLD